MPLPTIAGAFGNADAEFHLLEVLPGRSTELAIGVGHAFMHKNFTEIKTSYSTFDGPGTPLG